MFRALELFAGPGGMALGVHLAGFQHLALVERERYAADTLRVNSQRLLVIHPDLVIHQDAKDVDYTSFLGQVDLLAAGPPCQPFSNAGRSLGPDDPRNMFPLLLDIVPRIMPQAMLIENVKGLTRDIFKDYFEYIRLRLAYPFCAPLTDELWTHHLTRLRNIRASTVPEQERYMVGYQVVNAADYGVPQRRERVLIHAFRADLGITPFHLEATHSKAALWRDQWVTGAYWQRHGLSPYSFLSDKELLAAKRIGTTLFPELERLPWRTVRDAISDLPEPVERGDFERFANHVQHPGAQAYAGHSGSDMEMPAKALKAGAHGTPGGENMIRIPRTDSVRYFTTREAARLQTFPDEWHFHGTWGACIQQLGNAVPVRLATLFASEIRARLEGALKIGGDVEHGVESDYRVGVDDQDPRGSGAPLQPLVLFAAHGTSD